MDRNEYIQAGTGILNLSLSARRAWIEISFRLTLSARLLVALRKESVDRNNDTSKKTQPGVALRKESVDRNRSEPGSGPAIAAVALRKESVDRN